MRKPFIAGNWKMNQLRESSISLASNLASNLTAASDGQVDVAVCPPSVYLDAVAKAIAGSSIMLGAQNMSHEKEGAFTGEISGPMLNDLGCQCVILGHSERRQFYGETDESVNQKTRAALACDLIPIVCVGETLEEREAGQTATVVETQIRQSLEALNSEEGQKLVIAYEPVWAIGTGKTATPEQAEDVHAQIRGLLGELFGEPTAQTIRIQYGGSVKPDNAAELLGQPNIDGALVGGASLKADGFAAIVKAAMQA